MRRLACTAALCVSLIAVSTASAQGIAPPPPIDPNAPGSPTGVGNGEEFQQQQTQARLDEAEREDSKRKFELVWFDAQLGGSYIDMRQLSESDLNIEKASSVGPAFSLGGGVRFVVLVLGARARHNALAAFNMWQLNGEVGLKFPISSVDLLFGLHGGYSFVGSLGQASLATNTSTPADSDMVKVRGWNAGLDMAVDYYVSPTFSVGVGGIADFLFLNRPPVAKPDGFEQLPAEQKQAIESDPLYQKSGTSAGFQAALMLRLGLHFGL
jgi:hypothetical protein